MGAAILIPIEPLVRMRITMSNIERITSFRLPLFTHSNTSIVYCSLLGLHSIDTINEHNKDQF